MGKGHSLFVLLLLGIFLFSGCLQQGKSQSEIDLEKAKVELEKEQIELEKMKLEQATIESAPTPAPTTAPVPAQQVETAAPPPTAPPPWAYLFSSSTPFSEVIPTDFDRTEALTDTDYNFVLKFPSKPADYDDGAKVIYKNPTGTIYVLRFQSASGAAKFFEFTLNKIEQGKEAVEKRALAKGGQPLDVYHRTESFSYFGTLVQKGVFIYYLQMHTSAYDAESYITENLGFLFVPDILSPTTPPTTTPAPTTLPPTESPYTLALCEEKSSDYERDICYYDKALNQENYRYCILMSSTSEKDNCLDDIFSKTGDTDICSLYSTSYKKTACFDSYYYDMALNQENHEYCEQIGVTDKHEKCLYKVAIKTTDSNVCNLLQDSGDLGFSYSVEGCLIEVALESQDYEVCSLISPGIQCYDMSTNYGRCRDYCYYRVALKTNDLDICEYIMDEERKDRCVR